MAGVIDKRFQLVGRQFLALVLSPVLDRLDRPPQPVDGDGAGIIHGSKHRRHHARPPGDQLLPGRGCLNVAGTSLPTALIFASNESTSWALELEVSKSSTPHVMITLRIFSLHANLSRGK